MYVYEWVRLLATVVGYIYACGSSTMCVIEVMKSMYGENVSCIMGGYFVRVYARSRDSRARIMCVYVCLGVLFGISL